MYSDLGYRPTLKVSVPQPLLPNAVPGNPVHKEYQPSSSSSDGLALSTLPRACISGSLSIEIEPRRNDSGVLGKVDHSGVNTRIAHPSSDLHDHRAKEAGKFVLFAEFPIGPWVGFTRLFERNNDGNPVL